MTDPLVLLAAPGADDAAGDPVRRRIAEALARRAAAQEGDLRALMLRRLEELRADLDTAPGAPVARPPFPTAGLVALSAVVDRLGRPTPTSASMPVPMPLSCTTPMPSLKAVAAFQGTWSRLRVAQRLRQALAQVPPLAGPLNSSHLVNRALQAMQGLSPAYLDAFMTHVDNLHWLEQASGGGGLPSRAATPAEARRRSSAKKPPRL